MIPIENLKPAHYYRGHTMDDHDMPSDIAAKTGKRRLPYTIMIWDGSFFRYHRYEAGIWLSDTIHHFSDPERLEMWDGFIPIQELGL